MVTRRVFVIWQHPLFHESVRLLLNHPDVEWVGATSDATLAESEISKLQPDTILVEESPENPALSATGVLVTVPWNVRVVGVSFGGNKLSVFHREQKIVGKAEDLLNLVLGESP